jgi:hypothetical protein
MVGLMCVFPGLIGYPPRRPLRVAIPSLPLVQCPDFCIWDQHWSLDRELQQFFLELPTVLKSIPSYARDIFRHLLNHQLPLPSSVEVMLRHAAIRNMEAWAKAAFAASSCETPSKSSAQRNSPSLL